MAIPFISSSDSVLEIAERVVTIVGIVFVVLQLVLQTRQLRQSNYLAVMQSRTDISEREMEKPALYAVYDSKLVFPKMSSEEDWDALTPEQKVLYFHLGSLLSYEERAITLFSQFPARKDDLKAELEQLRYLTTRPIFRQVWPVMKRYYNAPLVSRVEEALSAG